MCFFLFFIFSQLSFTIFSGRFFTLHFPLFSIFFFYNLFYFIFLMCSIFLICNKFAYECLLCSIVVVVAVLYVSVAVVLP